MITLRDFLNAGKVNYNKFPDIYFQYLEQKQISSYEFLFLRSLWIKTLDINPHRGYTVRGTASYLQNLLLPSASSYVFQSSIRNLKDLKLISVLYNAKGHMRGVSLSTEFLEFSSGSLFSNIYLDEITLDIENRCSMLCPKSKIFCVKRGGRLMSINQVAIHFDREPILRQAIHFTRQFIITRKPILSKKLHRSINWNAKKYQGLSQSQMLEIEKIAHLGQRIIDSKLKRIRALQENVFTPDELIIRNELVPYYENLICKISKSKQFKLLSNSQFPKKSKNWVALTKIYYLCQEHDYDFRVYLDAQFESFKHWKSYKDKTLFYPHPHMLYSERAIKAYENYIYNEETSYNKEGWSKKAKPKNTGSYYEELKKKISKCLSYIDYYLNHYWNYPRNAEFFKNVDKKYNLLEIQKGKIILDNYLEQPDFCPEYLATLPGITAVLESHKNLYPSWDTKIQLIQCAQRDTQMETIKSIVAELEADHNIPKSNIALSKIEQIIFPESSL